MKWRNAILLSAIVGALMASSGCSQERNGDVTTGLKGVKARHLVSSSRIGELPDGTSVPEPLKKIVELRERGDLDGYLSAARDFLRTNRNDFVAADVMAIYARMRMTNEFRVFGHSYAANSPALLLEFAEIANNASWSPGLVDFARSVTRQDDASYAELFRSAKFLVSQGCADEAGQLMQRIKTLAVKRYQKEDAELLECDLAALCGAISQDTFETLDRLAKQAMMPQVRKNAARLLETIQSKE